MLAQGETAGILPFDQPVGGACQQHDGHEHALLGELLAQGLDGVGAGIHKRKPRSGASPFRRLERLAALRRQTPAAGRQLDVATLIQEGREQR